MEVFVADLIGDAEPDCLVTYPWFEETGLV